MQKNGILPFHSKIIEHLDSKSLVVLGRGLGEWRIIVEILANKIQANLKLEAQAERFLYILLNPSKKDNSQEWFTWVNAGLSARGIDSEHFATRISSEMDASERHLLYKSGGIISVSNHVFLNDLNSLNVPFLTGTLVSSMMMTMNARLCEPRQLTFHIGHQGS